MTPHGVGRCPKDRRGVSLPLDPANFFAKKSLIKKAAAPPVAPHPLTPSDQGRDRMLSDDEQCQTLDMSLAPRPGRGGKWAALRAAAVCQKSRFSRRLLRCISDRPRSQARWPSAYPHPPAPRPQGRGEKMAALRAAAAFSAALRRRYQQASNRKSEVFRQAGAARGDSPRGEEMSEGQRGRQPAPGPRKLFCEKTV